MIPNEIVTINGERYHAADSKGRAYVRLTFKPAGAKRRRTTWAVKGSKSGSYFATDGDGNVERDGGKTADGKMIDRIELILIGPTDKVTEKPAGYTFKYGELVVLNEGSE